MRRPLDIRRFPCVTSVSVFSPSSRSLGCSRPSHDCTRTADHVDSRGRERAASYRGPSPATYKGLTSGEWTAAWWQAVFATPVEGRKPPVDHWRRLRREQPHGVPGGAGGAGGISQGHHPGHDPGRDAPVRPDHHRRMLGGGGAAVPWRGRGRASRVRERSSRPGVGPLRRDRRQAGEGSGVLTGWSHRCSVMAL